MCYLFFPLPLVLFAYITDKNRNVMLLKSRIKKINAKNTCTINAKRVLNSREVSQFSQQNTVEKQSARLVSASILAFVSSCTDRSNNR